MDAGAKLDGALSLPEGGGAVAGIGETFTADPHTGVAFFTIPVPVPPARGDVTPRLALQYSSGSGHGLFGLGWSLALPRISRRTEKGIPRYADDVFVLTGAEELVRAVDDARLGPATRRAGPFLIERFRPRTEGLFARIERWTRDDGSTHWRAATTHGVTSVYGLRPAACVADPGAPGRVAEWLLEESYDARGNHMRLEYAGDDPALVIPDEAEAGRGYAQRYPRRILYANSNAAVGPSREGVDHARPLQFTTRRYLLEVLFDYGDLPAGPAAPYVAGTGAPESTTTWPLRPDRRSTWRYGFELRTLRRCERILIVHHFAELGGPTPVSSVDFGYSVDEASQLSFLTSATRSGYRTDAAGRTTRESLPPVTYTYGAFAPDARTLREVDAAGGDLPSVDARRHDVALADVYGDGLPHVIASSDTGMRCWRNLGGRYDLARPVAGIPWGVTLGQPGVALGDVDGDGRAELVVHSATIQGYYESTNTGAWESFRPYATAPAFDVGGSTARLVDLTGDGRADVLLTLPGQWFWCENQGAAGYGPPQPVAPLHDAGVLPDLSFAEPSNRVRLADMTGDGLHDIVHLGNGRIDYWPNLGYGQFGDRITMASAPALPDGIDPARLFLADLTGSGCADLVYVDADSITFWRNQSGNAWSAATTIRGTPWTGDPAGVRFADVLGSGTSTLLWTGDPLGLSTGRWYALDFCAKGKPYLLVQQDNNRGACLRLEYASSTTYALADAARDTPWITTLPFPVHVVASTELIDAVAGRVTHTSYSYHHGWFDGTEREFRGFARVDQSNVATAGTRDDAHPWLSPPVFVRTWFHTGAAADGATLEERLSDEFYAGDPEQLAPPQHDLPAVTTPADMYRALRGAVLRSETYAHDGSPQQLHPYVVVEQAYRVRELQSATDSAPGVYDRSSVERRSTAYERDPFDPRLAQELTLAVDDAGNVTDVVTVSYPRRVPVLAEQARPLVVYGRTAYAASAPGSDVYLAGLPCEHRSYEVSGLAVAAAAPLTAADLTPLLGDTIAARPFEWQRPQGLAGVEKRLLTWTRSYYRDERDPGMLDDPATATHRLALGDPGALALAYENYDAAYSDGLLAAVLPPDQLGADLATEGGYVRLADAPGIWWRPSGRTAYDPAAFHQPVRRADPFGNVTTWRNDVYALLAEWSRDPLHNETSVVNDYRTLRSAQITDANGNRSSVICDVFGRVVGQVLEGKANEHAGDSAAGFDAYPTRQTVRTYLADPIANAAALLAGATSCVVYDDWRYVDVAEPVAIATLTRETHLSEPGGAASRIRQSIRYVDGFGRDVQTKHLADPDPASGAGAAPRWITSGWVEYDDHGRPVRRYEPFYDGTPAFAREARAGVSATLFHDALGRTVGTLYPDHTLEKVVTGAWRTEAWCASDMALVSDPAADPVIGRALSVLPASDYLPTWYKARAGGSLGAAEQAAARQSAAHADTPGVTHLDPGGRAIRSDADAGGGTVLTTTLRLAIGGLTESVVDPRGIEALRQRHDMLDRPLLVHAADAGERWLVADAAGRPLRARDAVGTTAQSRYDALGRLVEQWVQPQAGAPWLSLKHVYGEQLNAPEARNHRTRLARSYDGAGVLEHAGYDFRGRLLSECRQVARDPTAPPDWTMLGGIDDATAVESSASPALDAEVLETTHDLDAVSQEVRTTLPDGSEIRRTFGISGLLASVAVRLAGETTDRRIVRSIAYDAAGRRLRLARAARVVSTYDYDGRMHRLARVVTRRSAGIIQDLSYTYDADGAVTRLQDAAQAAVFNDNAIVEAVNTYAYDALGRLLKATGREHDALGPCDDVRVPAQAPWLDLGQPTANAAALRDYVEQYTYDASGNLERISHATSGGRWTRKQRYAADSNRLTSSRAGCGIDARPITCDANGNITSLAHLPALTWDHGGRLVEVELSGSTGGSADHAYQAYDADGNRVRRVVTRGSVLYDRIYVGALEYYRERSGTTTTFERTTLHVEDDRRRAALIEQWRTGTRRHTRVRQQIDNLLGSAVLELDDSPSAAIISAEEFYPYGGTSYLAGTSAVEVARKRYRYRGLERDAETAFYCFEKRYYAPWMGRWISPDPDASVPWQNRYLYVLASPLSILDRSGGAEAPTPNFVYLGIRTAPPGKGSGRGAPDFARQGVLEGLKEETLKGNPGSPAGSARYAAEALAGKNGTQAVWIDLNGVSGQLESVLQQRAAAGNPAPPGATLKDIGSGSFHTLAEAAEVEHAVMNGLHKVDVYVVTETGDIMLFPKGSSVGQIVDKLDPSFRMPPPPSGGGGGGGALSMLKRGAGGFFKFTGVLGMGLSGYHFGEGVNDVLEGRTAEGANKMVWSGTSLGVGLAGATEWAAGAAAAPLLGAGLLMGYSVYLAEDSIDCAIKGKPTQVDVAYDWWSKQAKDLYQRMTATQTTTTTTPAQAP